jgi:small subunit ribosomal protein S1
MIEQEVAAGQDTAAESQPTTTAAQAPAAEGLSIDTLQIGQRLVGTVKNITDFGAFVDVGIPQDGLVHISKLAKRKIEKVSDVVSQGQQVEVWVNKVDKKRGRLSLTMIRPLALRLRDIEEGAELTGSVTRLEPYGAFIDIGSEREGLVHISQISYDYIKHPEEALKVNDPVTVKVLKVDRKKRQVDLSIKALLPPPVKEVEQEFEAAPRFEEVEEEIEEEDLDGPVMTALEAAYTRQGGKLGRGSKKPTAKGKRRNEDIEAIISRTLATRG